MFPMRWRHHEVPVQSISGRIPKLQCYYALLGLNAFCRDTNIYIHVISGQWDRLRNPHTGDGIGLLPYPDSKTASFFFIETCPRGRFSHNTLMVDNIAFTSDSAKWQSNDGTHKSKMILSWVARRWVLAEVAQCRWPYHWVLVTHPRRRWSTVIEGCGLGCWLRLLSGWLDVFMATQCRGQHIRTNSVVTKGPFVDFRADFSVCAQPMRDGVTL